MGSRVGDPLLGVWERADTWCGKGRASAGAKPWGWEPGRAPMATDDGRRRDRDPEALETEAGRRAVFSVPSWNLRGQGAGTQVCLLQTLPTRDSPAVTAPGRSLGCSSLWPGSPASSPTTQTQAEVPPHPPVCTPPSVTFVWLAFWDSSADLTGLSPWEAGINSIILAKSWHRATPRGPRASLCQII